MPDFLAVFLVERLAAFFAAFFAALFVGRFDAAARFAGLAFLVDLFSRPFCDTDRFLVAAFLVAAFLVLLVAAFLVLFAWDFSTMSANSPSAPAGSGSDFASGGVPGIKLSA